MAVIQANIGDFDKIAAEKGLADAAKKVVQSYLDLSEKALTLEPKPQIIVWPETSYPSTFRTPQTADELARDQDVERFVKKHRVPVLFGGYDHQDNKDYNSFFFLSPEADRGVEPPRDLRTYHKNVLLLFGEYIPGADLFPFIKKLFPQVGNFGRGVGPEVIPVVPASAGKSLPIQVGPIICYEALFPYFVIDAARKGSNLILNITNDSWFGPYGEPILHLSLTTFRGIETRLPQLRATNTGISTLIRPDGEITQATGIGEQTILNAAVPVYPPLWTLMKAWGDWFGWFALGSAAALSAWISRRRVSARGTT
jgi:apolipoprotein N-acyltransferase